MNVVIADDEPPARERLKRLLGDLDGYAVAGEAGNGEETLAVCAATKPDIVLLDIRMPGMDGISAARHLAALEQPPAIIFTTAYDQYAVDAFDTQAAGYLLKPVRRERLLRALDGARRLTRPQLTALAGAGGGDARREHICARVRDELRLIPIDDIRCFVADQKYVAVRYSEGEVLIDESLKALQEEFEPDFVRIHRNALVALKHVDALERDALGKPVVRLKDGGERLAVSRRMAADLTRRLRVGA